MTPRSRVKCTERKETTSPAHQFLGRTDTIRTHKRRSTQLLIIRQVLPSMQRPEIFLLFEKKVKFCHLDTQNVKRVREGL